MSDSLFMMDGGIEASFLSFSRIGLFESILDSDHLWSDILDAYVRDPPGEITGLGNIVLEQFLKMYENSNCV